MTRSSDVLCSDHSTVELQVILSWSFRRLVMPGGIPEITHHVITGRRSRLPVHPESTPLALIRRNKTQIGMIKCGLSQIQHRAETSSHDLLALDWSASPRNILCVRKPNDPEIQDALIEYVNHINTTYPDCSLIFEPGTAQEIHGKLNFPIYTSNGDWKTPYHDKVDLTTTLGGDGTILHAASLFATAETVPPVLSFSMGTLGFLGEWKFAEYKRAFREVYISRAPSPSAHSNAREIGDGASQPNLPPQTGLSGMVGRSMGSSHSSRILMRNRLKVGLFDSDNRRLPHEPPFAHADNKREDIFALNEVLLHRGAVPHLARITILIGSPPHQRILTTAIADGFLISTPTGSTAYSLSSGGSIVHPLVSSLLLTPICPRSLSFRPLVLPANTPITLRIDAENRGKEIEVSIDGIRRKRGLKAGMEVRVAGEDYRTTAVAGVGDWLGGVPIIVRSSGEGGEDHWVGGLNSLLKFNHPFGGES
nr:nadh kinase pos5, mitochondrial [Quercus suber]